MNIRIQQITFSGLFISLGILIPILFHSLGIGKLFLPMFWPIAVCGFFLSMPFAISVGILTPILSTLMTGMPPIPVVYKMIFELGFLSGTISFLYRKTRFGVFWLTLTGLFTSEIVLYFTAAAIAPILGLPPKLYAIGSLIHTIPGIITILVIVPWIIKKTKHEPLFKTRLSHV